MKAGFALAALLLDDRDLRQVDGALPTPPPDFAAELGSFRATASDRDRAVSSLLRILRPELSVAGALRLPPRARALIARFFPRHARKALFAEGPPARAEFAADEALLRLLTRLARSLPAAEGT